MNMRATHKLENPKEGAAGQGYPTGHHSVGKSDGYPTPERKQSSRATFCGDGHSTQAREFVHKTGSGFQCGYSHAALLPKETSTGLLDFRFHVSRVRNCRDENFVSANNVNDEQKKEQKRTSQYDSLK